MTKFFLILGIALLGAVAATLTRPAQAQNGGQVIELRPGFTRLLQFDRAIRTVAIGNPEVADASVQSDRAALLTAKRVGETNLIAIDSNGVEIFRAMVLVGGGETGRVVFHARPSIHEYWTYRCTSTGCQRVEDKFEFREPATPIVVAPNVTSVSPARTP
jgi:hypothetical protein